MDLFTSIVYGIIQGVTEFLPVSSSGHLALIPKFLKVTDPGAAFDLMMHVGTASAIVVYFSKEVKALISELFNFLKSPRNYQSPNKSYFIQFTLATFITGTIAFFIKEWASSFGRGAIIIGSNLVVFGVLMFISDRNKNNNEHIDVKKSLLIGLAQALAVFPGVSRSGVTLTTARFLGVSRKESARFSFLLSLPIIFIGAIARLGEIPAEVNFAALFTGVFVSFVVGLLTIYYFLKILSSMGLWVFALYRVFLAVVIFYVLA